MSEKVWLGAIYLKDEGGYEIILKSLNHYKKRLKTIGESPEMKDAAAMFASVLNQQASKSIPKIDETIKKIQDSLQEIHQTEKLNEDIPILEKSLLCYKADISKVQETKHEYFIRLVGDIGKAEKDLISINIALDKINQYTD